VGCQHGGVLYAIPELRFHGDYGEPCASPDLRYVLAGTNVWDTQTGQAVFAFTEPTWELGDFAVSPDGREVWASPANSGLLNPPLYRCRAESGEWEWVEGTGGRLTGISPDGQWLLRNGEHGPELWDRERIVRLRTFVVESTAWQWDSNEIASWFSADGQFVLAIGSDGMGRVWDLRDRLAGLRTSRVGGKLELRWELGTLQSADAVNGPWQDMMNAASPFQADVGVGTRFYRVKVEE
jgi:WD40 repeat protein